VSAQRKCEKRSTVERVEAAVWRLGRGSGQMSRLDDVKDER
jgi:hypothetical protein